MFVCETIWTAKNVHDDGAKIVQLETTFRTRTSLIHEALVDEDIERDYRSIITRVQETKV